MRILAKCEPTLNPAAVLSPKVYSSCSAYSRIYSPSRLPAFRTLNGSALLAGSLNVKQTPWSVNRRVKFLAVQLWDDLHLQSISISSRVCDADKSHVITSSSSSNADSFIDIESKSLESTSRPRGPYNFFIKSRSIWLNLDFLNWLKLHKVTAGNVIVST